MLCLTPAESGVIELCFVLCQVDINQMTQTWGVEVGKVELYVTVIVQSLNCVNHA